MTATSSAIRQRVLDRVRAATRNKTGTPEEKHSTGSALPRDYIRHGSLSTEARLELMIHRLHEYDAEVAQCAPEELAVTIAAQLEKSKKRVFAAPAGLPQEWLAEG